MNYKYIIPIIIIIIAVFSAYYVTENNVFKKNNTEKVNGTLSFDLPEGYKVVKQTDNQVDISNGDNIVNIYKLNSNDSVDVYKQKYSEQFTINDEPFSIEGVNKTVAKSANDSIIKYWFVKNDTKLQIQMISNEANSDKIAEKIINSFNVN